VVISIAVLLTSTGGSLAQQTSGVAKMDPASGRKAIRSVVINVVGTFLRSRGYKKTLVLTAKQSKYFLDYTASAVGSCGNGNIKAHEIEKGLAENFVAAVSAFKDEGPEAHCCDHPFADIVFTFVDGSTKTVRIGYDPLGKYAEKPKAISDLWDEICNPNPPSQKPSENGISLYPTTLDDELWAP